MFWKPKEKKLNTLANYNFQIQNEKQNEIESKLLQGT